MTHKEKAKRLIWKYLPVLNGWTSNEKTKLAKECALICLKEQKESLKKIGTYSTEIEYDELSKVQDEVEKMQIITCNYLYH